MPSLPPNPTKVHLDQDSDDIYQARVELAAHTDAITQIIGYLNGLFGFDGQKITALNTLGGGFPVGTVMAFIQPTVPLGWVNVPQAENYYLVCGQSGGYGYGAFEHAFYTTSTVLAQGHLPAINIGGSVDYQADHIHTVLKLNISENPVPNFLIGVSGGNDFYFSSQDVNTGVAGVHSHNVTATLGGQNWGHNHVFDMSQYRPRGLQTLLGRKS